MLFFLLKSFVNPKRAVVGLFEYIQVESNPPVTFKKKNCLSMSVTARSFNSSLLSDWHAKCHGMSILKFSVCVHDGAEGSKNWSSIY